MNDVSKWSCILIYLFHQLNNVQTCNFYCCCSLLLPVYDDVASIAEAVILSKFCCCSTQCLSLTNASDRRAKWARPALLTSFQPTYRKNPSHAEWELQLQQSREQSCWHFYMHVAFRCYVNTLRTNNNSNVK